MEASHDGLPLAIDILGCGVLTSVVTSSQECQRRCHFVAYQWP